MFVEAENNEKKKGKLIEKGNYQLPYLTARVWDMAVFTDSAAD